jgi:hypothetical protein
MSGFSIFHWIIFAAIMAALCFALSSILGRRGTISQTGTMICPACGTRGEPRTITRGSLLIEIVLWLCFVVPGLIYTLWRLTTRQQGCPSCEQSGMIPVDSPVGKRMLKESTEAQ